MFGEGESESPRVPSPWDSLMSTPPDASPRRSPSPSMASILPKLVPENEEGNVEYKLQLLNPSPARFARLVTQLKWRLLEGGGQAYYELGVADSGELIGLERDQLERTLETLEMMAGEIGASVIVVKEIEIPARILDDDAKRRRLTSASESATDVDILTTEAEETETDSDLSERPLRRTPSDTIFSMDNDFDDAVSSLEVPQPVQPLAIDLEIASVYKPRPFRQRVLDPRNMIVPGKRDRHHGKGKKRSHLAAHDITVPFSSHSFTGINEKAMPPNSHMKDSKTLTRRQARDKRREGRRMALIASSQAVVADIASTGSMSVSQTLVDGVSESLESLHVSTSPTVPSSLHHRPGSMDDTAVIVAEDVDEEVDNVSSSPLVVHRPSGKGIDGDNASVASNPGTRLIVEALVVRKMSIEEAFLDFGGFQIT